MTLSKYLIFMLAGTLISWGAWFLVLVQINPYEATAISFLIFYVSLFLSLVGTLSIIGFLIKAVYNRKREPYFRQVKRAFRHSLFFSLLIVVALILQSQKFLNWWNLSVLVASLILFELYFLTGKKQVGQ